MPHEHYTKWLANTADKYSPRSGALEKLDKAIDVLTSCNGYPHSPSARLLFGRVKIALSDWMATKPAWQNSVRNAKGAITALKTTCDRIAPNATKHATYIVPKSQHTPNSDEVEYKSQSKGMNCWWACSKMLLEYHLGEKARRKVMSASVTAKKIYDANTGIFWHDVNGQAITKDFGLKLIDLTNVNLAGFSTADILPALMQYGPLMFTADFVRNFGGRWYEKGHVIVVYGVEYEKVWFHDPNTGLELFRGSQSLDWDTFKNAWHPTKAQAKAPVVHAYTSVPAALAAVA